MYQVQAAGLFIYGILSFILSDCCFFNINCGILFLCQILKKCVRSVVLRWVR